MPITKENVKKIQRHRYYEESVSDAQLAKYHKALNDKMLFWFRKLMIGATKCNSLETLLVGNIDTGAERMTSQNSHEAVNFTTEMEDAILTSGYTFIAIHNHPNNSTFSVADVLVLVNYPNLQTIYMCPNDCSFIEVLDKGNKDYKTIVKIVLHIIGTLVKKKIISKHCDAKYLIKFLAKHGFIYEKYRN